MEIDEELLRVIGIDEVDRARLLSKLQAGIQSWKVLLVVKSEEELIGYAGEDVLNGRVIWEFVQGQRPSLNLIVSVTCILKTTDPANIFNATTYIFKTVKLACLSNVRELPKLADVEKIIASDIPDFPSVRKFSSKFALSCFFKHSGASRCNFIRYFESFR